MKDASLIHDLMHLRRLIYQCQFLMSKADRIIYGTPLVQEVMNTTMWFSRSYETKIPEDKVNSAEEASMWFTIFRMDIRAAVEENLIKFPKRKTKSDDPVEEVNSKKIEIVELVAKIDNELCRWRKSLYKGQDCVRCAPEE